MDLKCKILTKLISVFEKIHSIHSNMNTISNKYDSIGKRIESESCPLSYWPNIIEILEIQFAYTNESNTTLYYAWFESAGGPVDW